MSEFEKALSTVFSVGTLQQMLRSATPVALAAIGGSMTEHAGIMNIGMDGMILMGAFFAVLGSFLAQSAFAGVALTLGVGLLVGLFFGLLVVRYRSDEFIIGCAINTFAVGLTSYLSRSFFGTAGAKGNPALRNKAVENLPVLADGSERVLLHDDVHPEFFRGGIQPFVLHLVPAFILPGPAHDHADLRARLLRRGMELSHRDDDAEQYQERDPHDETALASFQPLLIRFVHGSPPFSSFVLSMRLDTMTNGA